MLFVINAIYELMAACELYTRIFGPKKYRQNLKNLGINPRRETVFFLPTAKKWDKMVSEPIKW